MRTSDAIAALRADLMSLASIGDEATTVVAQRLADAMTGPVTVRLFELFSQLAAELDRALPEGRVEVRLLGQDAELVYVEDAQPPDDAEGEANARITLRLPEPLKNRIETAAAKEGVSVNTYIVRTLGQRSRVAARSSGGVGHRLTGHGRS